jgi:hypothetical protein
MEDVDDDDARVRSGEEREGDWYFTGQVHLD